MAIGTWETQNKVRPGVYINYVFSDAELINYASEGVLALNYSLPLNPEGIVEITSTAIKQKALEKYGVIQGSDAYKYITTLLKYSSKLIIYSPAVTGGKKAELKIPDELNATAIYPGYAGNKISVEVVKSTTPNKSVINTYFNDELVAIQNYDSESKELEGTNDFATIEVQKSEGDLSPQVPTLLSQGLDGTINYDKFAKDFFESLLATEVEVVAICSPEDQYDFSLVEDFINNYNANHVQKVVAVYPKGDGSNKNSEFVIAVAKQTATLQNGLVLSPELLAGYIGAKEAGATYTDDLTFNLCDDIVEITELSNEDIENNIKTGIMNLSLRSDRSVVIEDDINSLVLLSENQSSSLKSNDTLRLLNDLSYRIVSYGENVIIGKKKVTETTLNIVKAFVIEIMNQYAQEQVIINFDSNNDVQVVFGEQPDGILCTIAIQKTNSAKKLYFSIGVR